MSEVKRKQSNRAQRDARIRARIHGTTDRPRMMVKISNMHVSAQIINDDTQHTLAYATTVGEKKIGSMTEKAAWVGEEIAKKAKSAKVKKVAFDRGRHLYHGRVKALAEAARKQGLEF